MLADDVLLAVLGAVAAFAGTFTSPAAAAAVLAAGLALRWRPWPVRLAAGAIALALSMPGILEAEGTLAAVLAGLGALGGGLLLAEAIVLFVVPVLRFALLVAVVLLELCRPWRRARRSDVAPGPSARGGGP